MKTGIVRIENYDIETLNVGTKVVMCCDYQITIPWVEEVVNINDESKEMVTTYDQVTSITVDQDQVYGIYIKEANWLETLYYTASFLTGYLLLIACHLFVLIVYYLMLIKKSFKGLVETKQSVR